MPPSTITSPIDSIGLRGQWNPMGFQGTGLHVGDHIRWVPLDGMAKGCAAPGFTFGTVNSINADGEAHGQFRFNHVGGYFLCYRFLYRQMRPRPPPSGWVAFLNIRTVVLETPQATPNGTAVGCMSNITVSTTGLDALHNLTAFPTLSCTFTTRHDYVLVTDTIQASDSLLSCNTAAYTAPNVVRLELQFGTLRSVLMEHDFLIYDPQSIIVTSAYPRGGWFNYAYDTLLTGGFKNAGAVHCRFGNEYWGVSSWATVYNSTHMRCEKPAFPDDTRDDLGALTVHVSPNGQCYTQTSTSFVVYNSLIDAIDPIGSPSSTSTTVSVLGEGFPYPGLPGAKCSFTRQVNITGNASGITLTTPLTVVSPTLAKCMSPAAGVDNAKFVVTVSLNGESIEPLKFQDKPMQFTECAIATSPSLTLVKETIFWLFTLSSGLTC